MVIFAWQNPHAVSNLGKLLAERGNVTMIGLAVNQGGRASATTAVSANGSIRLLARDNNQLTVLNSKRTLKATRTGSVVFGERSLTDVTLDQSDATAVKEQVQERSVVEAMGSTIALQTGSAIVAPSGALRGKAVTVDIRKGTPLADVSGAVANIRRDVAERSTAGGNVTLASEGDTVVLAGSGIDVSGGAVNYRSGYLTPASWYRIDTSSTSARPILIVSTPRY